MKKNIITNLTFHYIGINKTGQKINGDIEARSLTLAKIELRRLGIIVNKIAKKPAYFNFKNKKISSAEITLFSRELATLIESGIPLAQSLNIVAVGQTNPKFKELLLNLKQDIETGLSLAEALQKHPVYFNKLFCNLVESGENSGTLDIMLDKIALYKEKMEQIKKRIKKALIYPFAVLIIAFIITAALLIFVVPQFEALFLGFGADLPAVTQALVSLSKFFQSSWYLIIGSLSSLVYAVIHAKKQSLQFTEYIDRLLLNIPLIGPIVKKASIARFTRTLAIMFAAGLPLVDALKSVAGATGNIIFSNATNTIRQEIATGQPMYQAIEQTQVFPDRVIQMIAVGEESGTLDKMLTKLADFYEEEVDNAVDSLSSLLEPIIMSVLGILIGGLVIAMYLPIFKLGSAI